MLVTQWLAPKRQPVPQNSYAYYQPNPNVNAPAYGMQNFAEPPPGMKGLRRGGGKDADDGLVYSGDMPPTYQPPPSGAGSYPPPNGGTKIPSQQNGVV